MRSDHDYLVRVQWQGNLGTGTSGYREYTRDTEITAEGMPAILASADVPFHGSAERWNPELLLLAALSQCHLLSYLYVALKNDIVVESYSDSISGVLRTTANGGGSFVSATLRPDVTISKGDPELAASLHKDASELCFIAASVNFPLTHEPRIQVIHR
ncbi:organic hydroperoxide reductase OsmC/OhrA [Leifsonia sp. AK011]|uniref:OsmC family protein n=1 Tax=Leifsonia sp. AK011 TaxID=2723075 RepID=UPI0015C7C917|nr:OsmC family protein [Leifsonia sp. AK011]NYF10386.1 organic hydroperoxide reductase OsmC/OhrA [Leifsonia sp. AK011]